MVAMALIVTWPVSGMAGPTADPTITSGKAVYEHSCITCHGDDGTGGMPGVPDMTKTGGSLDKPDVELIQNIINGFQSPGAPLAMPARGGNPELTDEQVQAVIDYIRHAFSVKTMPIPTSADK
jgi:cytochrome c5